MRAGLGMHFFAITLILAGLHTSALVSANDLVDERSPPPQARNVLFPRQSSASADSSSAAAAATSSATPAASSSQQAASTNTPAASSTQPAQTSTTPTSTAQQQQSTTQAAGQSTPSTNAAPAASSTPTSSFTSALVTTNPAGQIVTSVVVVADTPSSSAAPSQTSAASNSSGGGDSSGISSSTIIGLSVAGGVAVICVVGFFVWKFTRKRLGDYDNNEEIKWPELNSHDTAVPLPTNRTGGAGFDTAPEARRSSIGYAPSTAANSTAEFHPDPYAVPPLPHLDPNQPYHDDPNSRFYDPYRGPVPQSFDQAGVQAGEAIPMTQLAGRRSPGPSTAFGAGIGGSDFVSGRASPAPPHAAYGSADFGGGRASPAPPPNYGVDFGGRASPGPRAPYSGGRMSPGPQAAYGNVYGPR